MVDALYIAALYGFDLARSELWKDVPRNHGLVVTNASGALVYLGMLGQYVTSTSARSNGDEMLMSDQGANWNFGSNGGPIKRGRTRVG